MITLTIALRNIFRHKTRSLITLSTIIFGCSALIFAGGFFEDVFYKMRESYIHSHTGHFQIFKKGYWEKGNSQPYDYLIDNPDEIISHLQAIPGIKFITSRLQFSGLISTGENTVSCIGMGIDPGYENQDIPAGTNLRKMSDAMTLEGPVIIQGKALTKNNSYAVMLGKGLASSLGITAGDALIILTHTTGGSINALDVTAQGIFMTSSKEYDDHFLRLPLETAKKLLHTDSVQSLVIMLNKTEDTVRVKKALQRVFQDKELDLELKAWDEISDFYRHTVNLFNRLFLILKLVIAIIVILSIFNTMNMAVLERTDEIGTIMALGTKKRGVLSLFMHEGLGLGIIGGSLGVLIGITLTQAIARIGITMPPPPGATMPWVSEPRIVLTSVVFAFMTSILTALVSSLYPAYSASRLEIADCLRHK